MEQTQQDHLSGMDIQIDQEARQSLHDASKWTKFISIIVFVLGGLMLFALIFGGTQLITTINRMTGRGMNFLYDIPGSVFVALLVFAVILLVALYYFLFNFAVKTKQALISEDATVFNAGLKSLKTFLIISTVLSILSVISNIVNLFK